MLESRGLTVTRLELIFYLGVGSHSYEVIIIIQTVVLNVSINSLSYETRPLIMANLAFVITVMMTTWALLTLFMALFLTFIDCRVNK